MQHVMTSYWPPSLSRPRPSQRSGHWRRGIRTHAGPTRDRSNRRTRAVWARGPGLACHCGRRPLDCLCLHKRRDNSASIQAETTMSQNAEQRCYFAGVAGDREVDAVVLGEYAVQRGFGADVLRRRGFRCDTVPELVVLGEATLDSERGVGIVDVRFVAAAVAGVDADAFTEELLYQRDERGVVGEIQTGKGDLRGLEAAA